MIMLRDICWFALSIPDVVWSGIIASVITLSGVFASNWSNNNRLKTQLLHDAKEKQRDRLSSVRREVYLKAVREIALVADYLGRLSTLDPVKTNPADGLRDVMSAASQVGVVCEPETYKIVSALTLEYANVFFRLLEQARQAHNLKIAIDNAKDDFDRHDTERKRLLYAMQEMVESGKDDPKRFATLSTLFDDANSEANLHAERKQELEERHQAEIFKYSNNVLDEMRALGELQLAAGVAIRGELGLETDVSDAIARQKESTDKIQKRATDFMTSINTD